MNHTDLQEKVKHHPYLALLREQQKEREEQARIREQKRREEEELFQRISYQRRRIEQSIQVFFETDGLFLRDPEGKITSQQLYGLYRGWCIRENIPIQPPRAFFLYAKKNAAALSLVHSVHIPTPEGKRVRGFYGARLPERGDGTDNNENS